LVDCSSLPSSNPPMIYSKDPGRAAKYIEDPGQRSATWRAGGHLNSGATSRILCGSCWWRRLLCDFPCSSNFGKCWMPLGFASKSMCDLSNKSVSSLFS